MKAAILLVGLVSSAAAQRRPFAPEDVWQWKTASDPRVRPDGAWAVWAETYADREADVERSNLWVASTNGRDRRRWTEGPWLDWSPRWSPDGERIAWLSDRGGQAHLRWRRLDADAETEIRGAAPPDAFSWSPDGSSIAFTARPPGSAEGPSWAPLSIVPRLRTAPPAPQIFVAGASAGVPKQVSHAEEGCWGEPAWSLDGRTVFAVCNGAIVATTVQDGSITPLTKDSGRYEHPVLSPDGRRLAFLFTENKPQTYSIRKVVVMNADGSRARALSGSLDRDATAPQWSSESRTVYFLADDRGSTRVYAARNDGTVRQVTSKAERLEWFSLADNGRAVSIRSSPTEGGAVLSFTVDVPSQPVTLADPNGRLLAERQIGAVDEIGYESAGNQVQAWIVKPPSFDPGKKYPLLVDVADDPRRMYGVEFSLRAQILSARGFLTLHANPRGSPGYGEQYGHLLRTRYPGDDFDDLMRGVDAAAAKGFVDADRISIAGGLVAAWAIGHTKRFERALARRPVVDWAVDLKRAGPMGAMPWEDPEQYVKRSPLFFARDFHTPTLVLAPEDDAQANLLYDALRMRKVPAAFVRWNGARPSERIVELEAILGWLAQGAR